MRETKGCIATYPSVVSAQNKKENKRKHWTDFATLYVLTPPFLMEVFIVELILDDF